MAPGKFLEVFERFDFHPPVLVKSDMYNCTGPKFGRQDFFGPPMMEPKLHVCTFGKDVTPPVFVLSGGDIACRAFPRMERPPCLVLVFAAGDGPPAPAAVAQGNAEAGRGLAGLGG
jgi:hypothetical protein